MSEWGTDFDALTAIFQINQYRDECQQRYDEAKRDLRNAKEIQSEILTRINSHVRDKREGEQRAKLITDGTSSEGMAKLRESLGMDSFNQNKKKQKEQAD